MAARSLATMVAAIYSDSVMEDAIIDCRLLLYIKGAPHDDIRPPLVERLVTRSPHHSASLKQSRV